MGNDKVIFKGAHCISPEQDMVNHPEHYKHDGIETIDVIKAWFTSEEYVGFNLGNTIKYISRWKNKGGLEDLKKARWYLNKTIKYLDMEE